MALSAKVQVFEAATFHSFRTPFDHSTTVSTNDTVFGCLRAIKDLLSTHLEVPLRHYFVLPVTYWTTIGQLMLILSKIFVSETSNWDRAQLVSDVFDPVEYLDRLLAKFPLASKEAGLTDNNVFIALEWRMKAFRGWIDAKLTSMGVSRPGKSNLSAVLNNPSAESSPVRTLLSPRTDNGAAMPMASQHLPLPSQPINWSLYQEMWGGMSNGLFMNVDETLWATPGVEGVNNENWGAPPTTGYNYGNV